MAGSFSNSWALVKASANVLKLDKELLVFPLMSGIATVLLGISFLAPFALTGQWQVFAEGENASYLSYSLGFAFYMAQYTIIFFFNAALVGAALIRLDGGDPTVSDGLAIASKRMGAILGFALISATVGMIFRFIAERSGFLGRIVAGLMGMAWTLATYLAVPILVTKDVGPIDAVKESAGLFRKTWGEQVVGNFGMGWAFFMIAFGWTALSVCMIVLMGSILPALVIPLVITMLFGYVFLALVASALKGVYTAALYRYAMTGEAGYFDPGILGNAFRPKR